MEKNMEETMILHNPTQERIIDYPIQHPKTKETFTWSIGPGETLKFPKYVGEYLWDTYKFLQKIMTPEQLQLEKDEMDKLNQGRHFERVKLSQPKQVTPPPPAPGFTNDLNQKNPSPYNAVDNGAQQIPANPQTTN